MCLCVLSLPECSGSVGLSTSSLLPLCFLSPLPLSQACTWPPCTPSSSSHHPSFLSFFLFFLFDFSFIPFFECVHSPHIYLRNFCCYFFSFLFLCCLSSGFFSCCSSSKVSVSFCQLIRVCNLHATLCITKMSQWKYHCGIKGQVITSLYSNEFYSKSDFNRNFWTLDCFRHIHTLHVRRRLIECQIKTENRSVTGQQGIQFTIIIQSK